MTSRESHRDSLQGPRSPREELCLCEDDSRETHHKNRTVRVYLTPEPLLSSRAQGTHQKPSAYFAWRAIGNSYSSNINQQSYFPLITVLEGDSGPTIFGQPPGHSFSYRSWLLHSTVPEPSVILVIAPLSCATSSLELNKTHDPNSRISGSTLSPTTSIARSRRSTDSSSRGKGVTRRGRLLGRGSLSIYGGAAIGSLGEGTQRMRGRGG
jgi:hypothetical protein